MKPKQKTIDAAKENGSIARMERLISAVQILNCEANNLTEEANDLMMENNLSLGLIKKLHTDFVKSADKYFKEFEILVHTEESKMAMFSDLQNFDKWFREWMESPSDYKAKQQIKMRTATIDRHPYGKPIKVYVYYIDSEYAIIEDFDGNIFKVSADKVTFEDAPHHD